MYISSITSFKKIFYFDQVVIARSSWSQHFIVLLDIVAENVDKNKHTYNPNTVTLATHAH